MSDIKEPWYLYHQIAQHFGHKIEIANYGNGLNYAIECVDCSEVIVDEDRPNE